MAKTVIRDGDSTTTGGVVMASAAIGFDRGRRLALTDDVATCGHCDGTWKIFGSGTHISIKGRAVVVEGDRVRCPCNRNFVVANREAMIRIHAGGPASGAADAEHEASTSAAPGNSAGAFDDRYVIRDLQGLPLADVAYALCRDGGEFEYGVTDAQGRTHFLARAASVQHIDIFLVA